MSLKHTKVLTISHSISPFLESPDIAVASRRLPQGILDMGNEVRVFMPRFGCINERRHQLHEVIRLSGMNLIINDTDHALLIKVASVPNARMQVYFIDNEEYFKRKAGTHENEGGAFFQDNDERALFFCRGVLETVRKLGWVPDIIHCHGWMPAFIPLYIKHFFADDPHFEGAKLVYSVYDHKKEPMDKDLTKKLTMEGFDKQLVKPLQKPSTDELYKFAIGMCDAVVKGSPKLSKELAAIVDKSGKPILEYLPVVENIPAYAEFYASVLEEALVN
jgi:starch synthase